MTTHKPISVLIVDDESELRVLVSVFLQLEVGAFEVHTAKSAQEARKIIEQHPIELVLTDLKMPNEDGFALAEWIMKRGQASPKVLLMTGYIDDVSISEARQLGISRILDKPLDVDQLTKTLKRALGRYDGPSDEDSESA